MTTDVHNVRRADRTDVPPLSRMLGRAFYHDPLMKWMVPDDHVRERALAGMFTTMTRHHFLAGGGVEVAMADGAVVAATLWDPLGRWKPTRQEELRMTPGLLWALRTRARVVRDVDESVKRNHPNQPHWYLAVIGSDPTVRGAGFAQALLRSRLDRCDTENLPAYLESTNPDNVPYYQRFGFEVTGEIATPDGGPSLWAMWREPDSFSFDPPDPITFAH
jgi:ribosomal protein S18 acetylase RimI-like enzyme